MMHAPVRRAGVPRPWWVGALVCAFTSVSALADGPAPAAGELRVEPATVTLNHHRRPHSLVVTTTTPDGLTVDLTTQAAYQSGDPQVATVDAKGWITPVANGKTKITLNA